MSTAIRPRTEADICHDRQPYHGAGRHVGSGVAALHRRLPNLHLLTIVVASAGRVERGPAVRSGPGYRFVWNASTMELGIRPRADTS
jgi:hypothetical protein